MPLSQSPPRSQTPSGPWHLSGQCQGGSAPSHPQLCCHHAEPPPPQQGERARSWGWWGPSALQALKTHSHSSATPPFSVLALTFAPGKPCVSINPFSTETPQERRNEKSQQCPAVGTAAQEGRIRLPTLRGLRTFTRHPHTLHAPTPIPTGESPGETEGSVGKGEGVSTRELRGHGLGRGATEGRTPAP